MPGLHRLRLPQPLFLVSCNSTTHLQRQAVGATPMLWRPLSLWNRGIGLNINDNTMRQLSMQLGSSESVVKGTSPLSYSKRGFTSRGHKPHSRPAPRSSNAFTSNFEHTLKTLRELHTYVKTHLSLDIWTLNLLLVAFVVGPTIWNAMKNSPRTEDDYMFRIPVDDPVEHSVRILMDLDGDSTSDSSSKERQQLTSKSSNIISPEEDAKRILNDLLASENLRTTASRIASSVIQSPPFQNACRALVKNIWDDLASDPETTTQLVTLVQTVLQNERVYSAVKAMMIQLVNDEEVYAELTKLVVQIGEEKDVLQATQKLLTESAHRTLNDPDVLDHSMEFATEVVGDDVVQRTGGEALRNTVGYAVQPSGSAVLVGLGTMIVAGVFHFYFLRGGGNDTGSIASFLSPRSSPTSSSSLNLVRSNSFNFSNDRVVDTTPARDGIFASLFLKASDIVWKVISFPQVLIGSIHTGVVNLALFPQHVLRYCSGKVASGAGYVSHLPHLVWMQIASIPSWIGNALQSLAAPVHAGIANIIQSLLGNANAVSKTTKGALSHVVSTLYTALTAGTGSLMTWASGVGNRRGSRVALYGFATAWTDFWQRFTGVSKNS